MDEFGNHFASKVKNYDDFQADLVQRVDAHHEAIGNLNAKLDKMMAILEELKPSRASEFNIATPQVAPRGAMETHTAAQIQRSAHLEPLMEPGEDARISRDAAPVTRIPMPRWTYSADNAMRSWYAASPPMTTFVDEGNGVYNQGFAQSRNQHVGLSSNPPQNSRSMRGQGCPLMTVQNFRARQKPNSRLFVFDCNMVNYRLWRNRMKDHLCNRSTRRYDSLLNNIEASTSEIRKTNLVNSTVDGVNAWEVAEELEGFIFDFVDQALYERRGQFTNFEQGNGFEAWRQIHLEFVGGGAIANVGGFRRIQEYPRCDDLRKLHQHLADWEELVNKYGQNLMICPDELRTMTLGIIPRSHEDELLHREREYPTWRDVLIYCRKRTRELRHKAYADLLRHPKPPTVPKQAIHE